MNQGTRLLTDEQIEEMRKWFNGPGTEQFQSGEVISLLFDHIRALQSAPSAQPKGESGVTIPSDAQLNGVIRGLDMAAEYCGATKAWDSQGHIREAAAAIGMLRNALRSPAACAASQETERCYSQVFGLPCEKPAGHEGNHSVNVAALRLDESKAQMTRAELDAIHAGANALAGKTSLNAANEMRWHEQVQLLRSLAKRLGEK